MEFRESMVWHTQGMRPTAQVRRGYLDGVVGTIWDAESEKGASGHYRAEHPHIMIFFTEMSRQFSASNHEGRPDRRSRPMPQAMYIPAGVPLWTGSNVFHKFSHFNLSLHHDRLKRYLSPAIGSSAAATVIQTPAEVQDAGAIQVLAELLADEISNPTRHTLYAESLLGGIVAKLLTADHHEGGQSGTRLSPTMLATLAARVDEACDYGFTVADMAAIIGLPAARFTDVFKLATGTTPMQWQLAKRIDRAKVLLAETGLSLASISAQLGFFDQAHFTKAFRTVAGETPGAWSRMLERE